MNETIVLDVQVSEQYDVDVSVDGNIKAEIDGSIIVNKNVAGDFEGAYEYTPTRDVQIIEISQKKAVRNITINPIPQNYGLIEWNGLGIRVL